MKVICISNLVSGDMPAVVVVHESDMQKKPAQFDCMKPIMFRNNGDWQTIIELNT